jgi:Pro-kumamolisin, activation domain
MSDARISRSHDDPRAESRTPIPPGTIVSFEMVLRYPSSSAAAIRDERERLLAGARSPHAGDDGQVIRGADPADIDRVRAFAKEAHLKIESVNRDARSIQLSGEARTVNAVFGITLMECRSDSKEWREYDGELRIPSELTSIVESTLGLSTKPVVARPI